MNANTFGTWLAGYVDTPGPFGDLAAFCAGQCNCRGCTFRGLSVGPVESIGDVLTELNTHFGGGPLSSSPMYACLDLAVKQWRAENAGHRVVDHVMSCLECGGQRLNWSNNNGPRLTQHNGGTRVVQVIGCGQCGHVWPVEITRDRQGAMRLLVYP